MKRASVVGALAVALSAASPSIGAEVQAFDAIKSQAELDTAVTALDAALFDAYNRCDLAAFKSLLADDVEFYHDVGGVTLGAEALNEFINLWRYQGGAWKVARAISFDHRAAQ